MHVRCWKHPLDCRESRFLPGAASFAWICTARRNKAGCNPAKLTVIPHNRAVPSAAAQGFGRKVTGNTLSANTAVDLLALPAL